MKLKEAMPRMSVELISQMTLKLDNLQLDTIFWEDFLRFLESEGELRELINEMRIN